MKCILFSTTGWYNLDREEDLVAIYKADVDEKKGIISFVPKNKELRSNNAV